MSRLRQIIQTGSETGGDRPGPARLGALARLALRAWRERHALGRARIARAYIRGSGLEIGALDKPLRVPRGTRVRFVDRMTVEQLRAHYREVASRRLAPVDIVDDGERLSTVPDASQDFVIANHFLEHCQDPIGALTNQLRVLRERGVLYLAVPDKRFTFDRDRPVTPLHHLIEDHEAGPARSRRQHFEEWARLVAKVPEEKVAARVARLMAIDYSIHFHVWTPTELLDLLLWLRRDRRLPFDLELFLRRKEEMIVVLRKTGSA